MSRIAAASNPREALAAAAGALRAVEGAARDARLLLAHAAGLERDALHRLEEGPLDPALRARFAALVARRAAGEPVSRILGYREFWKHRFRVTPDVLDPRPETEILVAEALSEPFGRVLDLGTGSGCILVSLLAERPCARGVGTDISPAAVLVAGENAAAARVDGRLVLPLSDWFADIGGRYDLIVSNPPYIAASEMAGLPRDVRGHDPAQALTDGGDGLSAYRAIAGGAPGHLRPGGRLLVEIGPGQGAAVAGLFAAAGLVGIRVLPDLDGRDRVIAARLPA